MTVRQFIREVGSSREIAEWMIFYEMTAPPIDG